MLRARRSAMWDWFVLLSGQLVRDSQMVPVGSVPLGASFSLAVSQSALSESSEERGTGSLTEHMLRKLLWAARWEMVFPQGASGHLGLPDSSRADSD